MNRKSMSTESEREYIARVDAGNRQMCDKIGERNSAFVMASACLSHEKKPQIATVIDGRLVIGGVVMPPECIGEIVSPTFKWHGWEGVVEKDGKRLGGGFHFPKSEVVIAVMSDGRKVFHGGDSCVCTMGDRSYESLYEAITS